MENWLFLIILLTVLVASFIFWKLSQIVVRGRCLIPLKWRIISSLVILMLIPALLLFGLAIAIMLALGLLMTFVAFILSWFKVRKC